MMRKQVYALTALLLTVAGTAVAQTKIKDGSVSGSSSIPNSNAVLELESTQRGLLLPRLPLQATNTAAPLSAHTAGMTVYNTATAGTAPFNVSPGWYYNDGAGWVRLATTNNGQTLTYGNGAPTGSCTGAGLYTDTAASSLTLGQQWTCSGGSWVVYTAPSATAWKLVGTDNDAGSDKTVPIWRNGWVMLPYTSGNWSNIFGFGKNVNTPGYSIGGYLQMTPQEDFYMANQASGVRQLMIANMSLGLIDTSNSSGYLYAKSLYANGGNMLSKRGALGQYSNVIGFADLTLGSFSDHTPTTSMVAYMQMNPSNALYFGNATGNGFVFAGNVAVNGTLSKSAGTFKIDHPQDPANKYLIHSFVESPDMMNVYNGNVVTDASGMATVKLPGYFEAENKDFRYQLTTVGGFALTTVYKEISNNEFVIQTDKPNTKVSWQVTGIRNDEYAKANRIVDEVEKTGTERGKYLHPELFNQPQTKGIYYSTQNGQHENEVGK